jgi:hypothetical protein
MNSYEAKKLNLPEIMSRMGYEPIDVKKGGNEYWYHSPFRVEKNASFHTSHLGGKWIWNDFGDSGGTVIDFIMRHQHCYSVSDALKYLDGLQGKASVSLQSKSSFFQQQTASRSEAENFRELEFLSAKPIQSRVIIDYLTNTRKLDEIVVRNFLEEVRYKNLKTGKEFFAFGIQNQSGGYEIRVASDKYTFKSSLIEKDISLIKGFKTNGVVNVFEGMTDFLSLLTMMRTDSLHGDSVLMHSVSSYNRTLNLIREGAYQKINLFLDNDKSGMKTVARFQDELGDVMENQSEMFLPFGDLNEMLQSQITGA